jgi:hypothetical protein
MVVPVPVGNKCFLERACVRGRNTLRYDDDGGFSFCSLIPAREKFIVIFVGVGGWMEIFDGKEA